MDFKELMEKVTAMDGGEEMAKVFTARLHEVNNEAKNQRIKRKKAESDLEENKNAKNTALEELNSTLSDFGIDVTGDVKSSLKTFADSQKNTEKFDIHKDPSYIKQQKQIEKLVKINADNDARDALNKKKLQQNQIVSDLSPMFSKDIMNGNKMLKLLVKDSNSKFMIDENGDTGFKLDDGDIITGADSIMEAYKKLNPDEIVNIQKSGSGSKPTTDSFKVPDKITNITQIQEMSAKQLAALPEDQQKKVEEIIAEHSTK